MENEVLVTMVQEATPSRCPWDGWDGSPARCLGMTRLEPARRSGRPGQGKMGLARRERACMISVSSIDLAIWGLPQTSERARVSGPESPSSRRRPRPKRSHRFAGRRCAGGGGLAVEDACKALLLASGLISFNEAPACKHVGGSSLFYGFIWSAPSLR